jgi:Ca2+-binding RTX toxin-like protein
MAILSVPGGYPSITAAMNAAGDDDTIVVAAGEPPENVLVTKNNITIDGPASVVGIELIIDAGVTGLTLAGDAPINVMDTDGNNTIAGNDGDNTITVTGGTDTISGGLGDDRAFIDYSQSTTVAITGTASTITSSLGTTAMSGFEHYTVLTGASDDTLTFGSGNHYLDTAEGISTIVLGNGDSTVLTGDGADTITVGTGNNTIVMGDGINTFATAITGFGNNIITGGTGADTITVGNGNNHITGGGGIDTGLDTIVAGNGENCIDGGDGANNTVTVGGGNNYLLGGDGIDAITAGNGKNFIDAGEGLNKVTAGTGDNYIVVGDSNDAVTAMGGQNNIQTGDGTNTVTTGTGNDVVETGAGSDTVTVGTGDNIVKVFGGTDVLTAGAGNDRLIVDYSASNTVVVSAFTGAGTYGGTISAGINGGVTITAFDEFHITTGSADDNIQTFDGADVLDGGAGADTLSAGGGNDVIHGGAGDIITGGEDVDGLDFDVLVLDGPGIVTFDVGSTEDGSVTLASGGAAINFTGIEDIVFGATTITTPEDTPLVGNLGVTVAAFEVGNISYVAGDTASRTEGDLEILANGTYTFTPAPNYNGPAPVINYTDSAGVTTPLFIEVTAVAEVLPVCLAPICFVRGTLIATADSDIPVEDLKVGDLVETLDHGQQPLRWVGQRHLDARELTENANLRPIRIRKDVVSAGKGVGDLVVSPQHRILIASKVAQRMFGNTEVLVSAKQLLGIEGIDVADDLEDVTYFHILFDQHEIIYANGVPSESLYLGHEAQRSLTPAGREEIHALFPEVASPSFMPTPCRPIIANKRARQLALRHASNSKPLLDAQKANA